MSKELLALPRLDVCSTTDLKPIMVVSSLKEGRSDV